MTGADILRLPEQATARQRRLCRACGHFRNDPATLEAVFKGLTSFGSAHASVRAEDGLCSKHDRYLSADATCREFRAP